MPKVQHPAFKEIVRDISDVQLEAHLTAGWVEAEPVSALVSERGPEIFDIPKGTRVTKK